MQKYLVYTEKNENGYVVLSKSIQEINEVAQSRMDWFSQKLRWALGKLKAKNNQKEDNKMNTFWIKLITLESYLFSSCISLIIVF